MSRTIELCSTVIKQPELLAEAITAINKTNRYGTLALNLSKNEKSEVQGGRIHDVESEHSRKNHVWLRFHPESESATPTYTGNRLDKGFFSIVGDEDYIENSRLGTLVGDHYNAEVVRRHFADQGHNVNLTYAQDGSIEVLMEENEAGLATASY
jgi:hypothetical protein